MDVAVILGGRGNREIGTRVALRQFDGIRGLRGWIGRVSQFKLLTKSNSISVFQIGNGFCFGTVKLILCGSKTVSVLDLLDLN